MKCNQETPCGTCVTFRRGGKCLESPPNPPSDYEKTLIEKRKNRIQRRKLNRMLAENGQFFKEGKRNKGFEFNASASQPTIPNGMIELDEISHWGSVAEANDRQRVTFRYPKQVSQLRRRKANFENIQEYAPLRTHHWACSQRFVTLSLPLIHLAIELAEGLFKETIIRHFTSFGLSDVSGLIYLINLEDITNTFLNFVDFCKSNPQRSICADAELTQQLSLGCCIISQRLIIEDKLSLGRHWLNMSTQFLECLDTPNQIGDVISFGIWVLAFKTPNLMLNETKIILESFNKFYDLVLQSPQILLYFEYKTLGNDLLSDAAARTWIIIKMAETEVSVLGHDSPSQLKFNLLRHAVQPEENVLLNLFKTDNLHDGRYYSRIHLMLYVCSRYFGRFKDAVAPRDLIFSYLLLHQEVNDLDRRVSESLRRFSNLPKEFFNLSREYHDLMTNLIMLKFFSVRLLLFIKLECSYFPSLRFANYVTNMMCAFNWTFQVAQEKKLTLTEVFTTILENSYFIDIMLLFLCCCFQMMFICVFAQFQSIEAQNYSIDTNYLIEVISESNRKTLQVLRSLKYSKIEVIARILDVIDSLSAHKESCPAVSTFQEFYLSIQGFLKPETWANLISICFGCQQVCKTHLNLLWNLAAQIQTTNDIYITKSLKVNTRFFRRFENQVEPFRFSKKVVETYMKEVVDIHMDRE